MLIFRQGFVSGRWTLTALKRPFFIFQSFVLHKNGVEFRQEENGIIRCYLTKLYDAVRRRTNYMNTWSCDSIQCDDWENITHLRPTKPHTPDFCPIESYEFNGILGRTWPVLCYQHLNVFSVNEYDIFRGEDPSTNCYGLSVCESQKSLKLAVSSNR